MSGSRNKHLPSRVILATAALLAVVAAKTAPSAQPVELGAPTPLLPSGKDVEHGQTGGGASEGAVSDLTAQQARPGSPEIRITPLAEPGPAAIGVLEPKQGGLDADLWRGTKGRIVYGLLSRVPGDLKSPTLRKLALRLLLSKAIPPPTGGEGGAEAPADLLSLRVGRLAELGEVSSLKALLQAVPRRYEDESITRHRIEALLLERDTQEACRIVRSGITLYYESSFWQKAMVFCQIVGGENEQAMIGLGLMREQSRAGDAEFLALAAAMTDTPSEMPQSITPSPLHIAMLEALDRPFPLDLVKHAGPGILAVLATAANETLEQRTLAAERALAAGALAPEILAGLYAAFDFAPEELQTAITTAQSATGVRSRALLYQAAKGQESPAARAEVLQSALNRAAAAHADSYRAAVQVLLPLLDQVPPRRELAWFAPVAGRAYYAAGRFGPAAAWLAVAREGVASNPEAAAALNALWPFARLAGQNVPDGGGSISAWASAATQGGPSGNATKANQMLLRACFQALGEPDPLTWSELATSGEAAASPAVDGALVYALKEASQAEKLGETVLLSLLILGEHGPAASHLIALQEVLAALMRVGLEPEARAIGIEAALANGI